MEWPSRKANLSERVTSRGGIGDGGPLRKKRIISRSQIAVHTRGTSESGMNSCPPPFSTAYRGAHIFSFLIMYFLDALSGRSVSFLG